MTQAPLTPEQVQEIRTHMLDAHSGCAVTDVAVLADSHEAMRADNDTLRQALELVAYKDDECRACGKVRGIRHTRGCYVGKALDQGGKE